MLNLHALLLGIVEGLTEFLPISSTGHLILVGQWLPLPEDFRHLFEVVVQIGAILAVVLYFWHDLWPWSPRADGGARKAVWALWHRILVAVVPALAAGALLADTIETHLFNRWVVAGALLVGGIALIALERRPRTATVRQVSEITFRAALAVGCFQCLALIPGTSRSAATILGALWLGFDRRLAARFSFFLAIPTLAAAAAYALLRHGRWLSRAEGMALAIGLLAAFVVAWSTVAFLMRFIQRHDFRPFGWYRIGLALIVLAQGVWWLHQAAG